MNMTAQAFAQALVDYMNDVTPYTDVTVNADGEIVTYCDPIEMGIYCHIVGMIHELPLAATIALAPSHGMTGQPTVYVYTA